MNLAWLGEGPDAKAVHEWADDGSYEVRLEWDKHIRLTYVMDALGIEAKRARSQRWKHHTNTSGKN